MIIMIMMIINIMNITSNSHILEKCIQCVYNWYLRVFLADHQLQTWS